MPGNPRPDKVCMGKEATQPWDETRPFNALVKRGRARGGGGGRGGAGHPGPERKLTVSGSWAYCAG